MENQHFFKMFDLDVCILCTNNLDTACLLECQSRSMHEFCKLAVGVCGHTFHHHCITSWQKKHKECPFESVEEWDHEFVENKRFLNYDHTENVLVQSVLPQDLYPCLSILESYVGPYPLNDEKAKS